jgi:beta-alanine degradation protein BauB
MTRIRLVLKGLPLSSRLVTYSGTKPIQMRAIVLTTTLCVAVGVLAQDHAKVDPEHVKVVAENDQVRVLRYHYGPHEKSARHSHPNNTVDVALTKGRVRLVSSDGTSVEHSVEAGAVNLNPASTHIVENLGDTPFEGLSIEPKDPRK